MKQKLLMWLALLFMSLPSQARDFTYEGIKYTVIDEDARTCMTRPGTFDEAGNKLSGVDTLVIPSIVLDSTGEAYTVSAVGDYSFYFQTKLKSVKLSEGITAIGNGAFYSSWLSSIELPESLVTIGGRAFCGCPLRSIIIPENVVSIGFSAFDRSGLSSIELPENLESIGSYAFYDCTKLSSIKLPESLKSLGVNAFKDCTELETVEILSKIPAIGENTFANCPNLKFISIPESVEDIDSTAFSGTTEIDTLVLNSSHLQNYSMFGNVKYLIVRPEMFDEIYTSGCNNAYPQSFVKDGVIYESTFSSNHYDIYIQGYNLNEKHIVLSPDIYGLNVVNATPEVLKMNVDMQVESVVFDYDTITEGLCNGVSTLRSVFCLDNVTSIEKDAFKNTGLSDLILSANLDTIAPGSFENVKLGMLSCNAVTPPRVDAAAFNFKDNEWPVVQVPTEALDAYQAHDVWSKFKLLPFNQTSDNGFGYEVIKDGNYSNIRLVSFHREDMDTNCKLTIPSEISVDGVTYIVRELSAGLFDDTCSASIDSIVVPATVRTIHSGAFTGTTGVKTVIFEDGRDPISIADQLGKYWENTLVSVIIGRDIVPVDNVSVFGGNRKKLSSVTFTDSVRTIAPELFNGSYRIIENLNLGNGVETIGKNAFANCAALKTAVIPENVKNIEEGAFSGCLSLTSVEFKGGLNHIGTDAFANASRLTSLDVYANAIDSAAFRNLKVLAHADIRAKHLSSGALTDLPALTDLKLSADTIRAHALVNVPAVESLNVAANVIEGYAFDGAANVTEINVDGLGSLDVCDYAFYGMPLVKVSVAGDGQFAVGALPSVEDSYSSRFYSVIKIDVPRVYRNKKSFTYKQSKNPIDTLEFGNRTKYIEAYSFYIGSSTSNGYNLSCRNLLFGTGIMNIGEYSFYGLYDCENLSFMSKEEGVAEYVVEKNAFNDTREIAQITLGNRAKELYSLPKATNLDLGNTVEYVQKIELSLGDQKPFVIPASLKKLYSMRIKQYNGAVRDVYFEETSELLEFIGIDSYIYGKNVYVNRPMTPSYSGQPRIQVTESLVFCDNPDIEISWRGSVGVLVSPEEGVTLDIGGSVREWKANDKDITNSSFFDRVVIREGVESIGSNSILIPQKQEVLEIPSSVRTIANNAFTCGEISTYRNKPILKKIHFADGVGVITIGKDLFSSLAPMDSISEIYLGRNIKYSESDLEGPIANSFPNIRTAVISDTLRSINPYTFADCHNLEYALMPENVEHVGKYAFKDCENLRILSMSENLKTIGEGAYDNCVGLERITSRNTVPPVSEEGENSFGFDMDVCETVPLYVPSAAKDDYSMSDLFFFFDLYGNMNSFGEEVATDVVITEEGETGLEQLERVEVGDSCKFRDIWFNKVYGDSLAAVRALKKVKRAADRANEQPSFYFFTPNPDVLSVNQEGMITVLKQEPAEVWVYALDGSDKKAVIAVNNADYLLGDLNEDKLVNGADINLMVEHVLAPEGSTIKIKLADMNGDGVIDGADINLLVEECLEQTNE